MAESEGCLIEIGQIITKTIDIYLGSYVEDEVSEYSEILRTLNQAKKDDSVNVHLSNHGGSCSVGFTLCHAIKNCKAKTTMCIEAPCYSMGAILALCGKKLHMEPKTFLMFHNYSTVNRGKGAEVTVSVGEYNKYFLENLKYFATPFLTQDEIQDLINDKDVYVHEQDKSIKARHKRHFKGK